MLEDVDQGDAGDHLDLVFVLLLDQDINHVRRRDQDLFDADLRGGLDLGCDTADRKHQSMYAEATGHRDVLTDLDAAHGREDGRCDADGRRVAFDAFVREDELDVHIVVADVFAKHLLEDGRHVLDGFFRNVSELSGRDDFSFTAAVGGRDFGDDGHHDAGVLRHAGVGGEDGQAVDHPDLGAFRVDELVALLLLDVAVVDLLLQAASDVLRLQDVVDGCDLGLLFLREVAGDPHQAAQFAKPKREFAFLAGSALRLVDDLADGFLLEVRDLAVAADFLRNETNEFAAVLGRVVHLVADVHFVAVPADA